MRGTVAKRLRKAATDNESYVWKLYADHYREKGFDDATTLRKWYQRSKRNHKYWNRYKSYDFIGRSFF